MLEITVDAVSDYGQIHVGSDVILSANSNVCEGRDWGGMGGMSS